MAYNVYVTKVKNLREAPNSDNLMLCEAFENTIVVGKDVNEQDLYLYFPSDGRISVEFGEANNLFRKKDVDGKNTGGFIDPIKRNVSAIRLRGNQSDGLLCSLESLKSFGDTSALREGDIVSTFNGQLIAEKYIPETRCGQGTPPQKDKSNKPKHKVLHFEEHIDTSHLEYNLDQFKFGDLVQITCKMHGTSSRIGYVPVFKNKEHPNPYINFAMQNRIINSFLSRFKSIRNSLQSVYEYDYVCGTRRTVVSNNTDGYYGDNSFRMYYLEQLRGKLLEGEVVYSEIVGYVSGDKPIMSRCNNKKLNDKEFTKQYGDTTTFHYGCDVGKNDMYVYRMTRTFEDGTVVEYSPRQIKIRCEQMGVKYVPEFTQFLIDDFTMAHNGVSTIRDLVLKKAKEYYDGADPIGKTHIREGAVLRICNREKFSAYKFKNFNFKVLEGIIKMSADAPDMEETEDLA